MLAVRHIAANTLYQIIARVFSSGSSFLITLIIIRHFEFSGYGDFAKVTALVTLFYLIVDFGFNAMFLQDDENKVHFRDLFYSRLIISTLLVILVNGIALFLPYNSDTGVGFSPFVRLGILIFSLTIVSQSMLVTASAVFQRELTYKFYMWANIAGSILTLGLVWIFSIFSYNLLYIFLAFLVGVTIQGLLALLFTKELVFPIGINISYVKKLVRDTLPITLILVFNLIYFRIDMIILSLFRPGTDVAVYDFSFKVFDFLIALPLFLSNSLYPSILSDVKNNQKIARAKEYVFFFVLSSFFIIIPMWFIAPLFSLFKQELIDIVIPLRILLISLPVFFGTNILQWLLIAMKRQKLLAQVYLFSLILNIALNILLIPSYGYYASAIITGISEVLVFIVFWLTLFPLWRHDK